MTKKDKVLLSVAIVTCNRSASLRNTLVSLSEQSVQPYEVIISDDSNNLSEILSNKLLSDQFKCKYITGPQSGLYANRNYAAKFCSGTHVRTMDDDHTFPVDHISKCLLAIKSDANVIWVIGEYYPPDNTFAANENWKIDNSGNITGLPLSIPGQLHPMGYSYVPNDMSRYYGIACGSTIYPRIVLEKNITNSEAYKFGILYLEYGARLLNKGFKIKHLSTTHIIHHCIANDPSVANSKISNGAQVYSMLMFSFCIDRRIKNQLLTTVGIFRGLISGNYSTSIVIEAFKRFRADSKEYLISK